VVQLRPRTETLEHRTFFTYKTQTSVSVFSRQDQAFHAGFEGQRGVRTWAKRVKILRDLGFIKLKAGPNGDLSFALLLNPYLVIQRHFKRNSSEFEALRTAFYARIKEVGAPDLSLAAEMRRQVKKVVK
jgi:hypothetical protein